MNCNKANILEEIMNENIGVGGKLDGTWSNGAFKLIIKGETYVSLYNGLLYGKGTMLYDTESFTVTSTHARRMFFLWTPFVERIKGNYSITNDELTASNVEGRYSDLNGIWMHKR
jgi:hypothetical protein